MPPFEASPQGDLALSVTRLIDAPIATVWHIATDRIEEWFCPKPWRAEVIEQDWRAGGRSALMMDGLTARRCRRRAYSSR
jgi:uncharacterized protein YndB with AHSA1/START domain